MPSAVRTAFDEDATAERVADHGRWMPVLVPAAERWLDALIVLDRYQEGAALWEPPARELRGLLRQSGAFRDVRLLRLSARPDGSPGLAPHARTPAAQLRPAASAVDPAGRTLTLVLTDGVAPQWRTAGLLGALRAWAGSGPAAVVQMLPEHAWERTALAPRPGRFRSTGPDAPNPRLLYTGYGLRPAPLGPGGIAVPVLAPTPEWLGPWARAVAGRGAFDAAAVLLPRAVPDAVAGPPRHPVGFEDFRARAQPDVFRLAGYLAAAPLNLAVMRTVQSAMLPHSPPSDLAEIVFSGLLHRVPGPSGAAEDDVLGRAYEFAPGVRERLLGTIRRDEADEVVAAVSAYLERHAPAVGARFTAALADPAGPILLPPGARHWAEVRSLVRRRQGLPEPAVREEPAVPDMPEETRAAPPGAAPRPRLRPSGPIDLADHAYHRLVGMAETVRGFGAAGHSRLRGFSRLIAPCAGGSTNLADLLADRVPEWWALGNEPSAQFLNDALPGALTEYLARYGDDAGRAERLLHALAYAEQGDFFTVTELAVAYRAVSGERLTEDDVDWLATREDGLVVRRPEPPDGPGSFRLPHPVLADVLRARDRQPVVHAAIADSLADVTSGVEPGRRWPAGAGYARSHLAAHAAAAGILDSFLRDPGFIAWADPAGLRTAARTQRSLLGDELGETLGATDLGRFDAEDSRARLDVLAVTALQLRHGTLAALCTRGADWRPEWSAPRAGAVSLGSAFLAGEHRLLVGGAGSLTVVAPGTGSPRDMLPVRPGSPTTSMSCIDVGGRPHAVAASDDGTVTVLRLDDGLVRDRWSAGTGRRVTVACTEIGGAPYALLGSADSSLHLWDLTDGEPTRRPLPYARADVFACTTFDGDPHAVVCEGDSVRFWNLAEQGPALRYAHDAEITALTCLDGWGSWDAVLGLANGGVDVTPLSGRRHRSLHSNASGAIRTTAAGRVDDRVYVAAGDSTGLTQVWEVTGLSRPLLSLQLPRPVTALHMDGLRLIMAMDGALIAVELRV
ncbi:MAG: WD40 repeat domain-containing protein [Streptomyces sp.]|nr:WD40 repeat domain-containing protein [Streptomyces sp.]